nr:pyruvate, phosphate dikinase [Verrucomicrobiota bacterium]
MPTKSKAVKLPPARGEKGKSNAVAKNGAKAAKAHKYVYTWGNGKADGDGSMKALLGGKGANLAEMTRIGLPVPPGFTITTEVCTYYYANKRTYPAAMQAQVETGVANMEKIMGTKFGDTTRMPLLVAVRSGARDSMPGMMDTILNLGLNDQTVLAVVKATGNERFAWDCYRRFIQMYGDVVMGVQKRPGEDHDPFESVIEHLKDERYGNHNFEDTKLTVEDYKELIARFKKLIKERAGKSFPADPWDQLKGSVGAVFGSWMNDRAIVYRRKYNIPAEWGTAVNVQAMVFGNTGDNSGSGVAFTRDPATGEKVFYGEFLINAQGEDVVAGVRTPEPVADLKKHLPKAFADLEKVRQSLEKHFKDVQDFEFTIQDGTLFMLQTRNGKRTGVAAVRFAVEMEREKLIDWETAIMRVPADQLDQVLAPIFDRAALKQAKAIASGLPAGPGAATGKVYFNADRAAFAASKGEKVLLVRNETSPEDLRGMIAAEGILTAKGGVSSHAALVARQMGKVCICGASALHIDYRTKELTVEDMTIVEGDSLSIDGTSGIVYAGEVPTAPSEIIQGLLDNNKAAQKSGTYQNFTKLMGWCSKVARLEVRTNADNPEQTRNAISFGAVGIGLCRTEHMFFEGDRIDAMREMIIAENPDTRKKALAKLLPYQRQDFIGMFTELKGLPATIRLLDPPLHEFLPHDHASQSALAQKLSISQDAVAKRVKELHEFNPMLGHRGCRLGISFPEVTEMQARAIFEAAAAVAKKGIKVKPEIMIPLVGLVKELRDQKAIVDRVAQEVM